MVRMCMLFGLVTLIDFRIVVSKLLDNLRDDQVNSLRWGGIRLTDENDTRITDEVSDDEWQFDTSS